MIALAFTNARRALADRKGVTAAEYAVLATAIVAAVTAAVLAFGPLLTGKFEALMK
jgi:Flp pilus assembly pilin Flp